VHELAGTLVRWHLAGAVHGDLKWPNILLQKGSGGHKFLFIDLDQTKIYPSPSLKGITRDLKRFYRFGLELGAEGWVEKDFFPEYLNIIPETLKHEIDLSSIKKASFEEWARKGKKRY
jgi:tRNA A-37 threonylcarbamoyl transferase component Bud32